MKIEGTPSEVKTKVSEYIEAKQNKEKLYCYIGEKETKIMRSKNQNNFFYGLFGEIEKQTPFSSFVIKQYILSRVFGKQEVMGEILNNKTETSKLDRKEAGDLINGILEFCTEHTLSIKYTSSDFNSLINSYSE